MVQFQSVLIRSTPGGFEPRFRRAKGFLFEHSSRVWPIVWSRTVNDSIFLDADSTNTFKVYADYGRGRKNLVSHLKFFLFVLRRLKAINPKIIYACDLDALLPSLTWRMNKQVLVIFDQFDPFSSRIKNQILADLVGKIEQYIAMKSDIRITANIRRIPEFARDNWFELKNIFKIDSKPIAIERSRPPFILFYGGILAADRGLLACAAAISEEPDWELQIYGQGPKLELLSNGAFRNVFVHEPIPHEELMQVARNSDLYLAMYDPSHINNQFTASNKLFEAAQLGIPLLSSKGTDIGQTISKLDLGWSVDYDNIKQIRFVLDQVRNNSESRRKDFSSKLREYFNSQIELRRNEFLRMQDKVRILLEETN